MNIVTKAELARMFNVNQSRINALLSAKNGKKPKLIETEDGFIDLDNPHNKSYIEERKRTVPQYTGLPLSNESKDYEINDKSETGGEKDAQKKLVDEQRLLRLRKENELLDIRLAKEKKELVEAELLHQILMKSYENFYKLLMDYPHELIVDIRRIILADKFSDNEDLKLLLEKNQKVYLEGLENTRKAIKDFYDST